MEIENIIEAFLRTVKNYPDTTIFHYFQDRWKIITYREFSDTVKSVSSYLISSGIKKGDRIAIVSENRPEWCSAYFSIIMTGAIAVPMDSQLGPDEIKNLLYDSETKLIFHSQKTSANIAASLEKLSQIQRNNISLVNFDLSEYEMIKQAKPSIVFNELAAEDTASIIYTSGTTGNPKGVMLTHKNFCSDAQAIIDARIVSHEDNVLSILPLHHTYAFMCTFLVPVFLGASITYPASLKGPDLMSTIKNRGVSILIGVPQLLDIIRNGIINKIKSLPRTVSVILLKVLKISSALRAKTNINIGRIVFKSAHKTLGNRFRFFTSGGARLDPAIMKDLEALGFTVLEGYGLTETSPVVTFNPFSRRKPGSAGKPLPYVEIRISNPSETGEGEIEIKGPMVMKGYYKNAAATDDAIKDNWFKTGDIGRMDKDNYLFITGRSKEVIVLSSGKNIYPEDVEKIYQAEPVIKEICVLGREQKGITESLYAVIVPDFEYAKQKKISNILESVKWAINDASSKMPSYMRIKGYSIVKEPMPRTPLGKLRRFMIKIPGAQTIEKEKTAFESVSGLSTDEHFKKTVESLRYFLREDRKIKEDDDLELDIGFDSLSKIELMVSLEKIFSLKLPEDFMSDIHTVAELAEKIKNQKFSVSLSETAEKTGWKSILSKALSEKDLAAIYLEKPDSRMIPAFIIHTLLKFLFKLLFRLEAKGIENIPLNENFIITPNHTSYLDGVAVIISIPFSNFKNMYSLGLSSYFTGYLKSRFAKTAHVIPIDSASYLNKALQMSAHVLRNGCSLSVFPEGGRSFDGNLMEFKKGIGILAIELGLPVLPVFIKGAFESLPRGAKFPEFKKITVTFGKSFQASNIDFSQKPEQIDEYQHFANVLREKVKELKEKN